jgi:hypothetical protein
MLHSFCHDGVQVGVAAEEAWLELFVDAQHIMHYQYLPVYVRTCTNANDRNTQ